MEISDFSKISKNITLPVSWLSLLSTLPVILLILFAECVVMPMLLRYNREPQLRAETRIIMGYLLTCKW